MKIYISSDIKVEYAEILRSHENAKALV